MVKVIVSEFSIIKVISGKEHTISRGASRCTPRETDNSNQNLIQVFLEKT